MDYKQINTFFDYRFKLYRNHFSLRKTEFYKWCVLKRLSVYINKLYIEQKEQVLRVSLSIALKYNNNEKMRSNTHWCFHIVKIVHSCTEVLMQ